MADVSPGNIPLSPRELEVLRLLAQGYSVPKMKAMMYLSETTIKTHVRRMFDKLGAKNAAHAVMRGVETGVLVAGDSGERRHG